MFLSYRDITFALPVFILTERFLVLTSVSAGTAGEGKRSFLQGSERVGSYIARKLPSKERLSSCIKVKKCIRIN